MARDSIPITPRVKTFPGRSAGEDYLPAPDLRQAVISPLLEVEGKEVNVGGNDRVFYLGEEPKQLKTYLSGYWRSRRGGSKRKPMR